MSGNSWFNPSPEEAEEEYYKNKSRYQSAAQSKNNATKAKEQYQRDKQIVNNKLNTAKIELKSLEKRVVDIEKIISILEGTGGFLSTDVPDTIKNVNKTLKNVNNSFYTSIKYDEVAPVKRLGSAFSFETVIDNVHSSTALTELKKEKSRSSSAVDQLKKDIASLNEEIEELKKNIRSCDSIISSANRTMQSASYEMSHYKRFMYY